MERMLYLIRHGQAGAARGKPRCLSRTDLSLDEAGLRQAARLGEWAAGRALSAVFSSPLCRCTQTAGALAGGRLPVEVEDDLAEVAVGEWEGLTFEEIRARYPAEYAARGQSLGLTPPPGGESFADGARRFGGCIERIFARTTGNIAVVAHGGVNRAWLCGLLDRPMSETLSVRQPWGGISTLCRAEQSGRFTVLSVGIKPTRVPDEAERERLLETFGTPPPVRAHCAVVAQVAARLAARLRTPDVDLELLDAACRLHDLAREQGRAHAQAGAAWLDEEGYVELADTVRGHHDLPAAPSLEAELLYLADKLVEGDRIVPLERRFQNALPRCATPEARAAWQRRYDDALNIVGKYGLDIDACVREE